MAQTTALLAIIERHSAQGAAIASVSDLFMSNKNNYEYVVQVGQASTAIGTFIDFGVVSSISKPLARSIPMFGIATNAYAATVSFLKVVIDVKAEGRIIPNDVVSIAGNLAGIGLSAMALAASGPASLLLISVAASINGIISSDLVASIAKDVVYPMWHNFFKDNPSAEYPDLSLDPSGNLSSDQVIQEVFGGNVSGLGFEGNPPYSSSALQIDVPTLLLDSGSYINGLDGGSENQGWTDDVPPPFTDYGDVPVFYESMSSGHLLDAGRAAHLPGAYIWVGDPVVSCRTVDRYLENCY